MPNLAAENVRLQKLETYDLRDTSPEPALDSLVQLTAHILAAPMALLSLVDSDRELFKARFGLALSEAPRCGSFCSEAIRGDSIFVVHDASRDPRFAAHPLVAREPRLRFYAAAPLITPDHLALGTLCVLDTRPRLLSAADRSALELLGDHAMKLLEQRRAVRQVEKALPHVARELRDDVEAVRRLGGRALARGSGLEGTVQLLSATEHLSCTLDAALDLLDLRALTRAPRPTDLRALFEQVVRELGPGTPLSLGDMAGCIGLWDPERLAQAALLLLEEAQGPGGGGLAIVIRAEETDRVRMELVLPAAVHEAGVRIQLARELLRAEGAEVDLQRDVNRLRIIAVLPRTA